LELNGQVNGGLPESCASPAGVAGKRYRTEALTRDGVLIGTWVRPEPETCRTLKIFFPGQAQELDIYNSAVPPARRAVWAHELLEGKSYQLAPTLAEAGCPVLLLGEARASLAATDLEAYLAETGATQVELLAHSAGYTGLSTLVGRLKGTSVISKISAVRMLDNFYTPGVLPGVLKDAFGAERLREICSGFYTRHNASRYQSGFRSLCPNVILESDHKKPVKDHFR
jgi:hypothetical protein